MNRLDERWDRLAAGELSEAEHDELRGLADATGEGYEAYQAFKPLGAAFQQNVAAAILAQREREEDEKAEAAAVAAALAASQKIDLAAPPKVPERKGIFKWAGALAASTALVAGLLLFPFHRDLGQVYLSVSSETPKDTRGPADAAQDQKTILETGTAFQIVLRPEEKTEEPCQAKAFIHQKDVLVMLTDSWTDSSGGSFILKKNFPYFADLEDGEAELIGVYYRPGHVPSLEDIHAALMPGASAGSARDWRWDKKPVELRIRPLEPKK